MFLLICLPKIGEELTNDFIIALLVSSSASLYMSRKNLFNAASPSSFSSFSCHEHEHSTFEKWIYNVYLKLKQIGPRTSAPLQRCTSYAVHKLHDKDAEELSSGKMEPMPSAQLNLHCYTQETSSGLLELLQGGSQSS
nr:hypothetical protein Iba_chr05dCG17550 [Ipomoea batatas]